MKCEQRRTHTNKHMDLLRNAYSNSSDEDEQEKPKRLKSSHTPSYPPKPYLSSPSLILPGSYVSKRQRASSSSIISTTTLSSSQSSSFTLSGTIFLLIFYYLFRISLSIFFLFKIEKNLRNGCSKVYRFTYLTCYFEFVISVLWSTDTLELGVSDTRLVSDTTPTHMITPNYVVFTNY